MTVPTVRYTDERLPNGLRLVISEDHLVPVVAVNIWYDVGSKHEQPGKTGFAHLFEHVMFQGSRHVAKAEHIALVQAAGGSMNGTTWLDRTNYYETMPSHQLELALWLEADRMGTLLEALSQENLDNQRAVVKNEKRSSYDNQPYGTWQEKLLGHIYPEGHPYHHPTIGSMEDLDAASLEDVAAFFRTYYAPNNAVLSIVGDVDPGQARAWVERYFGPLAGQPGDPRLPPGPASADARRRAPGDGAGPRPAAAHLRRLPRPDARRSAPLRARDRGPGARRRQGQPAPPAARPRRADRPGRGHVRPRLLVRPVGLHGLGHRPAGCHDPGGRGRPLRRAHADRQRGDQRRRARPRARRSSRRTSWRRCSGSASARTGSACTRRCSTIQTRSTASWSGTWP